MGAIPIAVNVQGDYGYKIVTIEPEDTVENLIRIAVEASKGILVPEFEKGTEFTAKIHGADSFLDQSMSIKEANLLQLEAVDIAVKS